MSRYGYLLYAVVVVVVHVVVVVVVAVACKIGLDIHCLRSVSSGDL